MTGWARLVRASRHLLESVETALKHADLPPLIWYDVLLELERAGEAGLRPFQLQRQMLLAQYNTSRLLDRMVTAGVLQRLPAPDDRRGHLMAITEAGSDLRRRMWPVYRDAVGYHFSNRLSSAEHETLSHLLKKLLPPD